jgi:hypothetical protein
MPLTSREIDQVIAFAEEINERKLLPKLIEMRNEKILTDNQRLKRKKFYEKKYINNRAH